MDEKEQQIELYELPNDTVVKVTVETLHNIFADGSIEGYHDDGDWHDHIYPMTVVSRGKHEDF